MYTKLVVQIKDIKECPGDAFLFPKSKNPAYEDYNASDERGRHGYVETPSALETEES